MVTEIRGPQDDALGAWVEVYNASGSSVDLEGIKVRFRKKDGSSETDVIVRRSLPAAAGSYTVLGLFLDDDTRPAYVDYGFVERLPELVARRPPRSMSTRAASAIDRATYDSLPAMGTYSLGAKPPTADGNDFPTTWCTDATHGRHHVPRHAPTAEHRMSMNRSIIVARRPGRGRVRLAPSGERYTRKQAQKSLGKLEAPGLVDRRVQADPGRRRRHRSASTASTARCACSASTPRRRSRTRRSAARSRPAGSSTSRTSAATSPRPGQDRDADGRAGARTWAEAVVRRRRQGARSSAITPRRSAIATIATSRTCSRNKNGAWVNYNVEAVRAGHGAVLPEVRHVAPLPRRLRRGRGRGEGGEARDLGSPARGVPRLSRARGVVERARRLRRRVPQGRRRQAELHRPHALGRDDASSRRSSARRSSCSAPSTTSASARRARRA